MAFKIVNVFKSLTEEQSIKVENLLITQDKFTSEQAKSRVKELVYIAFDDDNVVGTCSGYVTYIEKLKGYFFVYRSYTLNSCRDQGIALTLITSTINFFKGNRSHNGVEISGIYVVFENSMLNNKIKKYVSNGGLLTLIGFDESGRQIRVNYFDGSQF